MLEVWRYSRLLLPPEQGRLYIDISDAVFRKQ